MDRIKQKAFSLKKKYGTGCPFELCRELNITIYYAELPDNVNGFFFKYLKNYIIVINDSLEYCEQRITAAHELGHIILHGETNTFQLSTYTNLCVEKLEREADYFASCLLIDDETLNFENCCDRECVTIYDIARLNEVPPRFVELYTQSST